MVRVATVTNVAMEEVLGVEWFGTQTTPSTLAEQRRFLKEVFCNNNTNTSV
jgi:hypothetical protein